ncbi:MAG: NAD(P)H-dependent oxidoreductase subunit E [Gemmataceae bacterium]|nr:NAD(P)H-dependent oxidoreductase subunit E [Gemmataceae bacterium]
MTPTAAAVDKRQKMFEAALRRHGRDRHALIEVLHTAQELYGYLSPQILRQVCRELDLPPSKVYGVATFYHFFSLTPKGEHSCTVCLGTACFVKRAADLVAAVEQAFQVKAGGVTKDGRLSLSVARCVGSCGLAPVAIVDDVTVSKAEPNTLVQMLQSLTTAERVST